MRQAKYTHAYVLPFTGIRTSLTKAPRRVSERLDVVGELTRRHLEEARDSRSRGSRTIPGSS